MSAFGRLGTVCAVAIAFLLSACGTQEQAPQFEQAFGAIDSPCGTTPAVSDAVQHCTAHVLLVNKGGEGLGHATIVVQLHDPKAGSSGASTVKCGRSIPDTPGGGYADLVCSFDLPPGMTVSSVPSLQAIDYTAAVSRSSSSFDLSSISTLILAGAILLLGIATLITTAERRPSSSGERAAASTVSRTRALAAPPAPPAPTPSQWASESRTDADAEFPIPPLPR